MELFNYYHLGSTSCGITMLSVVLACAVSILIAFPLGLLVGVIFCWCSKRCSTKNCDMKQSKPVTPRSIELNENPAYEHVHRIRR